MMSVKTYTGSGNSPKIDKNILRAPGRIKLHKIQQRNTQMGKWEKLRSKRQVQKIDF